MNCQNSQKLERCLAQLTAKAEDAYPTGAPGPCSQFLVESEYLICFCYFVCIILVTLSSLLCMSLFHVWSLSLYYTLLITAKTLVPLVTPYIKNFIKYTYLQTVFEWKEKNKAYHIAPVRMNEQTMSQHLCWNEKKIRVLWWQNNFVINTFHCRGWYYEDIN